MEYTKIGSKYFLRLDKGEEIVESIMQIIKKENIKLATVTGIGATDRAKIGLFEIDSKKYHSEELTGDMEILNLAGNISQLNEEPYIHLHIVLGDRNYNARGGHLNYALISATGEIVIDTADGHINREFNEEVGLNLLKF